MRRVSRDELYALVWKTPMSRLATEFGITGNGLAKICDRLAVPYPPRGYWAKKSAGKPTIAFKLPARAGRNPEWVDIHPTTPKRVPAPEVRTVVEAATSAAAKIVVPETLKGLHPKVKAWIIQHKKEQQERKEENKRRRLELWTWTRPLLENLTERDLYRFRVTSAIFKAVEIAGGKIEHAPISGKVIFLISGHKVECSIVEKMQRSQKQPEAAVTKWTAYPDHHQSGLVPSGFLRVTITTYLAGGHPEWVETSEKKIGAWLPEITGAIIGAGPILVERQREREETARRYREEEIRRYEERRLKEIEDRRWAQFRGRAADWEERARLLTFVTELQKSLQSEGDALIGDRQLSEWIAWAREKIDAVDPLGRGIRAFFEAISD